MNCRLAFPGSSVEIDFCSKGDKQKISIDLLTKYGEMDINRLASVLSVPTEKLLDVYNGDCFLAGEQADNLAHLFLIFLGKNFFTNCTVIRSFID